MMKKIGLKASVCCVFDIAWAMFSYCKGRYTSAVVFAFLGGFILGLVIVLFITKNN